jgi:hypothetical protein
VVALRSVESSGLQAAPLESARPIHKGRGRFDRVARRAPCRRGRRDRRASREPR